MEEEVRTNFTLVLRKRWSHTGIGKQMHIAGNRDRKTQITNAAEKPRIGRVEDALL